MAGAAVSEKCLDERIGQLESARQWSPRVISKLETAIRTADDYDLFRINPLRYGADKAIGETEAIDLFLYGTKSGLFEMEWHLVCQTCAEIVQSFHSMQRLHPHFTCSFCGMQNQALLDDHIHVTFTLSRHVRDLAYHHPETLSARDFFEKYNLSKGILPGPDGVSWYDIVEKYTKLVSYIEPGITQTTEFELEPGLLVGSDLINKQRLMIVCDDTRSDELQRLSVELANDRLAGVQPTLVPKQLVLGELIFNAENWAQLASGRVRFDVHNKMPTRASMWLVNIPSAIAQTKTSNEYEPYLSGKRLLSHQTFRDLFRSEVVPTEESIGVRDITFMFTDLKGSTELYDRIGDANAFYLVRQHFDTLGRVIAGHGGAIVKTIGDAVMATFVSPLGAVKAALMISREIARFNQAISAELVLKIGLHRGHSIVVTLNDKLDYFGQTVNIASRIQSLAGAGEIYVSGDVYTERGVAEYLQEHATVSTQEATLRGIREKVQVYRISL